MIYELRTDSSIAELTHDRGKRSTAPFCSQWRRSPSPNSLSCCCCIPTMGLQNATPRPSVLRAFPSRSKSPRKASSPQTTISLQDRTSSPCIKPIAFAPTSLKPQDEKYHSRRQSPNDSSCPRRPRRNLCLILLQTSSLPTQAEYTSFSSHKLQPSSTKAALAPIPASPTFTTAT